MNKRILSVLLVAVMAVAMIIGAVSVSAADKVETEDEFVEAVESHSNKITLTKDIVVSQIVTVEKSLKIELDGYTLTVRGIAIEDATLTISDSDDENTGMVLVSPYNGTGADATERGIRLTDKDAVLKIESGVVASYDYDGTTGSLKEVGVGVDAPIYAEEGKVVVNGGYVGCYLDLDTGKIGAEVNNCAIGVDGSANVEINGGEVRGTVAAIYVEDGKVTVNGGHVYSKAGKALQNLGGKVDLEGGIVETDNGVALYCSDGSASVNADSVIKATTTEGKGGTAIKVVDEGYVEIYNADVDAEVAIDTEAGEGVDVHGGVFDGALKCTDKVPFIVGGEFSANKTANTNSLTESIVKKHNESAWVTKTSNLKEGKTVREYVGNTLVKKHLTEDSDCSFIIHFANLDITNKNAKVVMAYDNWNDDVKNGAVEGKVTVNGYELTSAMQPGYQANAGADAVYSATYTYEYYEIKNGAIVSIKNATLTSTDIADEIRAWEPKAATEITKDNHLTADGYYLENCYVDTIHPTAGTYAFQQKVDTEGKPINTAEGTYNKNPASTVCNYIRPGTIDRTATKDLGEDLNGGIGAFRFDSHRVIAMPFVQPTQTTDGQYQHYHCVLCEKNFATFLGGSSGEIELVEMDPTISKLAAETTAPAETTAAPAETTAAPAETTAAPAETTAAPAETTAAPAETTAAPETQAPTPVNPSETGDNGMNALVWVIVLGAAITGVAVAGKSVLASKKH